MVNQDHGKSSRGTDMPYIGELVYPFRSDIIALKVRPQLGVFVGGQNIIHTSKNYCLLNSAVPANIGRM